MNEVLNNIYTRRSIRKFKEQDVPKDLVDEIVKAGTYAPSGKNLQTYRFYVMQNADSIKSLQDVVAKGMENPAYTLYGAKTIVLVACEKEAVNGVSDCSCAIENMLLAAHSLGLGACWINQLKYCDRRKYPYGHDLRTTPSKYKYICISVRHFHNLWLRLKRFDPTKCR